MTYEKSLRLVKYYKYVVHYLKNNVIMLSRITFQY